MAIVYENSGSVAELMATTSADVSTFSIDAGTNANRFVIVSCVYHRAANHNITGVTLDGNAMTEFGGRHPGGGFTNCVGHFWYYTGPAPGSLDVIVSHDGGNASATRPIAVCAAAYSGVDQSTPYDGFVEGSSNDDATPIDKTVSSETGDRVVTMYGTRDNTTGLTATDTNATQRVEVVQASKSATSAIADRPGATTVNTVQNEVTSTNYVIGGFSLNAAVVETARLRPAAGQGVEFDVYNTAGIGTQFTITKE